MISFKNFTNEENKDELKTMIINYYEEKYGTEWIDKYVKWLESHPQSKLRDFLIEDLKYRFSSKEDGYRNDMNLLFNNKSYDKHIAFGLLSDDKVIGYLFLTVHLKKDYYGEEKDRYGELYELYVKPEYRAEFLESAKRIDFVNEVKTYLEDYFKENNVTDILSRIPSEIEDLVILGKELGFNQEEYVSENTKDLWKKTI